MNRFIAPVFVFAFLPLAVSAQNEAVEINGKETLSGLWKISFPAGVSAWLPGRGRLYATGQESICRLQQTGEDLSSVCLTGWGPGTGDLDGKDLHLAWGISIFRVVIDAKIENTSVPAFQGRFGIKVFGIRHDAPAPASARKLGLDPEAPDTAGKAKLLTEILEELAAGAIVTPHVDDLGLNFGHQLDGNKANTPEEIRKLGKVEAVLYLGEGSAARARFTNIDAIRPPFTFSAYQVEFTNGQRLCGIHQREDGMLDGFVCI